MSYFLSLCPATASREQGRTPPKGLGGLLGPNNAVAEGRESGDFRGGKKALGGLATQLLDAGAGGIVCVDGGDCLACVAVVDVVFHISFLIRLRGHSLRRPNVSLWGKVCKKSLQVFAKIPQVVDVEAQKSPDNAGRDLVCERESGYSEGRQ
jgi:hypothetical protein